MLGINRLIKMIPEGRVFALESALVEYWLCNYGDYYVVLLDNSIPKKFISRCFHFIPNPSFGDEDIIPHPKYPNLRITTPERTICEMIACDRRDDFIIQALQNYVIFKDNPSYDENKLFERAKHYGVYDKLMQYLEWANEDIEDMC